MPIQQDMERALEGGRPESAIDVMRRMQQERSTVGEPVAAVAAREQALRQRQPLQPQDAGVAPEPAPEPATGAPEAEEVDVILPTGEEVTVKVPVGMSDEDVVKHLKAMGELPPDPSGAEADPAEKYRRGALLQGATVGTGDEWTAAVTAAAAKAVSWLPGNQPGEDETFSDIYNDVLESERYKLESYREAYPVESTAYEVAGALAPAVASGGTAAPLTIGRMAGTGAAWGGLYGAGMGGEDTEGTTLEQIESRAKGAATGAALGAVTGGAIGGVAKGLSKGATKAAQVRRTRKFEKQWNKGGLEGKQAILDDVNEAVTHKIAMGTPRLQAVKETLKEKGIPASKSRDLMMQNSGPIGWGKTANTAMDEIVANADVRANTVILGSVPILDKIIRPISTRIARHSPRIAQMLRNYEAKTHFDYHDWSEAATNWRHGINEIRKKNTEDFRVMTRHLYNGKWDEAKAIMNQYGGQKLLSDFKVVEDTLSHIRKRMKAVGIKDKDIPNYFPRVVKDVEGLKKVLGTPHLTGFDAYLKRVKDPVRAMEMYLKANPGKKERALRSRKVSEITDEIDKYYMNLGASLDRHYKEATSLIRRREFFGKNVKIKPHGEAEDTRASVDSLMDEFADLSPEARTEIADLLKSRFVSGEKNMYGWLQAIRNIGHTALLGNPISAATQLADLGPTAWVYGLGNTGLSLVKNTTGKGKRSFDANDLGVMRQMVQELNEEGAAKTTQILEGALEYSGFKAMDKLGKDAIITAAYNKASRMARSFHGRKQLMTDLQGAWGDETGQLVKELASGQRTELVRLYLFTQLSRMQPVSKSEMPQLYLDMPNGRILYQLLSWTIKQLDLFREEIGGSAQKVLQEGGMNKKSRASADLVKKMMAGYLFVGGMGVASDEAKRYISGKDSAFQGVGNSPSELGERMMQQMTKAMLKNYVGDHDVGRGLERYTEIGIPTGDVGWRIIKQGIAASDRSLNPVERAQAIDKLQREAMAVVPLVGKLYAMWFMGGAKEFNERERKERRKEFMEKFKH